MLSYKLDFTSCAIKMAFHKSSHISLIIRLMSFTQYKPAIFQPQSVDNGCLVGVQGSLLLINFL